MYLHGCCNRPLDSERSASVATEVASSFSLSFLGDDVGGSVNTSSTIVSRPLVKDEHLLCLENCCRFYCRFAQVRIDYMLI